MPAILADRCFILSDLRRLFEHLIRESRTEFADALELLRVRVVGGEQIGAVHSRALPQPLPPADDDEVERVGDAVHVVLLHLHPVALIRYVGGVHLQRLDHQALARIADGRLHEARDLVGIGAEGKGKQKSAAEQRTRRVRIAHGAEL